MTQVTFGDDLSLKKYGLTERVRRMRDDYFDAVPEICVERPRLITQFSLKEKLFDHDRITILDKARTYRHVLENRAAIVNHTVGYRKKDPCGFKIGKTEVKLKPFKVDDKSLFAGSTTSKFKGVPLYPEFLALTLWPELWSISKRKSNPFQISRSEVKDLNYNIFPHWMENNISELARKRCFKENAKNGGGQKQAPEMKLMERLVFFLDSKPECISHTIPDFSRVIGVGMREIINKAAQERDATADDSKKLFYSAIIEVFEGIVAYSKNLAGEAKRLAAAESDSGRKTELLQMAEANERVPEYPARNFHEGLTAVWVCWIAAHLENSNAGLSLGRLDQVLYDLYRKDIANKDITVEHAIELICLLWLKIGDHVPAVPDAAEQLFGGTGSNQAITIGGVDPAGNDAVNDLTYVMLRATELMMLRDPNLNARYYHGVNPEPYLRRICDANIKTGATPAIHNDKAIIKALEDKGETLEQARDYGIIGCVEPGSNGRFYGHSAAILLNLTSALELALFNGKHRHTGLDEMISIPTGDPREFRTFEEFRTAFEKQAQWLIDRATKLNNIFGTIHQDFYPTPILSGLFEGPMDKGKDLIDGGAVINSSGATIIGLADVADCLSAIQKVVFDEGSHTFEKLLEALEKDFTDPEGLTEFDDLRRRLIDPDRTPKYGNDNDVADGNVARLLEFLDGAFRAKTNYRGGNYRVGYWTMTNHAGFGKFMKALPNGRKAYENFTSGITPVSGVTPRLTEALNSVAKQDATHLSGGVALNLKFTPEPDDEKTLDRFVCYVKGYFDDCDGERDGGIEIQFNITKVADFLNARENPENHRHLLVRVSGYTAYFIDLNEQMQKEIVERTEYLLSTGRAQPQTTFTLSDE